MAAATSHSQVRDEEKDTEKQAIEEVLTDGVSSTPEPDPLLVTWEGEEDPANPLNWSTARKWTLTLLTSFGGLVCLMSSTMLAPALEEIADTLGTSQERANMTLSIFVLAYAFGPLILAPLAEVFGRRNVWLIASVWYTVWNLVCGFAKSNGLLLAARLMAGVGSSAEFAISNPVLGDLWKPEQRGHSFAIATFVPLLGPALGPVIGGAVANSIGYRWVFWILSVFDAGLIFVALFTFKETYGQLILHRKATRLATETGKPYFSTYGNHAEPLFIKLRNSLIRPTRFLVTQPTIQIAGLFLAFNYGTLFFVLTSYASLWTNDYHQTVSQSGLHYFALAIGYTIAAQGGARITDRVWKKLKAKAGGQTSPEYRVPLMLPGNILIPVGLLWYGWAAQARTHWIVVDLGAVIFGMGIILSTQACQQYVMESYREYVASAAAASQMLRSVFGFCFPLFAPALYARLGYGFGNTTIALVFVALAFPGPLVLWFFGARLRAYGAAHVR
ncbi:putative transporter [Pseudocercospora fuligena]|uniref:Cercosporin MFS transporter CTB4 n=1 Tax=Pseudocercospora fuligena TaxID=685502 RepID=A0A8H6R6W0_9PEZI|nr:putative transporter [Pseudocercospora fuligena]